MAERKSAEERLRAKGFRHSDFRGLGEAIPAMRDIRTAEEHVRKQKRERFDSPPPDHLDHTDLGQIPAPPPPPERPEIPDLASILSGRSASSGSRSSTGGFNPNAGLDRLEAAQARAAQSLASLDTLFEQRKEALREHYEVAETPEEKARIQHVLDIIETQRQVGTQVIERVYGEAITAAQAQAQETRQSGALAEKQTRETFQEGAQDASEALAALNQEFGGAMGVAGESVSPVAEATIARMLEQGESEAAFDRRLFETSAADIQQGAEDLRPEMGSQVGALQRNAAQTAVSAQLEHDSRVDARINAERMQMQQALQQLMAQFDQRRWGVQDQQTMLEAQAAQLAAENARHSSSMATSRATGGMTPEQQLQLEAMRMEYERQLEEFERARQQQALRDLGISPDDAGAAIGLGLGPDLGTEILRQKFTPSVLPQ